MGNTNPVTPLKTRLHIATGMSVQTVTTKGNTCQKAVANVFDFNGDGKYQENEAATFNSVRIRQHSKDNYTIWQKNNGKDKATHLTGDFSNLKFAPNRTKNTAPVKTSAKSAPASNRTAATIAVEDFVKQGKGELKVATYPNGAIKSKDYTSKDLNTKIYQEYYENGKPKSEKVEEWLGSGFLDTKRLKYYPNGKLQSLYTMDKGMNKKETKEYYENGNPKSEIVNEWLGSNFHDTKRLNYYPNGKLQSSYTMDRNMDKKETKEYYDNGKPKSHIVIEWDSHARLEKNDKGEYDWRGDYVEKTNIQYDKNGNVINTAKVNK